MSQHVAHDNAAICCVGTLRSFGRGFRRQFLPKQVNGVEERNAWDAIYNVILHTAYFINLYGFKITSRNSLVSFEAISSKQCLTANLSLSIIYNAKFMFGNVFAFATDKINMQIWFLYILLVHWY